MHIVRTVFFGVATIAMAGLLTNSLSAGGQAPADPHKMPMSGMKDEHRMMGKSSMTKEEKITNAMSAAPASVSGKATILDWPAKEGAAPAVLKAGTNGWSCFPDMPETNGNDPMCLDASWMKWVDAYLTKKSPQISTVGIGYMMAPGGSDASNSDPFATAATADNHWSHHPPHMMILVPDLKSLDGMSTEPANGGPYVMFKGTPYAHIMAPVSPGTMMKH